MVEYYIGVDIGGTNVRVGLISADLTLVNKKTVSTQSFKTPEALFKSLQVLVNEVKGTYEVTKIGLVLPIPWNSDMTEITDATNIPYLVGFSFDSLRAHFGNYELFFENDVNVAAELESTHGASKEFASSVYITVSTGIGSGIIVDNQLLKGSHGYGGELGNVVFNNEAFVSQNKLLSFENECSGLAIAEKGSSLLNETVTAKEVFDLYQMDHKVAKLIIEEWLVKFSIGISSVLQLIDPEIVVLGGSVITNNEWLIPLIKEYTENIIFSGLKSKIDYRVARFKDDVSIIGAANLCLKGEQ